jgi:hypothetical protein
VVAKQSRSAWTLAEPYTGEADRKPILVSAITRFHLDTESLRFIFEFELPSAPLAEAAAVVENLRQ